jgi:hypothetical protein
MRPIFLLTTSVLRFGSCAFRLRTFKVDHFSIWRLDLHLISDTSHHIYIFWDERILGKDCGLIICHIWILFHKTVNHGRIWIKWASPSRIILWSKQILIELGRLIQSFIACHPECRVHLLELKLILLLLLELNVRSLVQLMLHEHASHRIFILSRWQRLRMIFLSDSSDTFLESFLLLRRQSSPVTRLLCHCNRAILK